MSNREHVTYGAARAILRRLGFEAMPFKRSHIVYQHPPSESLIILSAKRDTALLRATEIMDLRMTLTWNGHLSEKALEKRLQAARDADLQRKAAAKARAKRLRIAQPARRIKADSKPA